MRKPFAVTLFAITLALFCGGFASGAAQQSFGFGKQEIGFSLGYSPATPLGGAVRNVQYMYAAPRWGVGISDPLGGDSWYRGNFEFLAEGAFLGEIQPRSGIGGGLTALFRYNFLYGRNFVPFIEAGGGVVALDFDLEHQKDGFNYSGHWGLGFHYFFSERSAFTGEWRIHHISNGQGNNNRGITNSLFLIGLSFFFN